MMMYIDAVYGWEIDIDGTVRSTVDIATEDAVCTGKQ